MELVLAHALPAQVAALFIKVGLNTIRTVILVLELCAKMALRC